MEGWIKWVTCVGWDGYANGNDSEGLLCRHKMCISCISRWEKYVSVWVEDVCAIIKVSINIVDQLNHVSQKWWA